MPKPEDDQPQSEPGRLRRPSPAPWVRKTADEERGPRRPDVGSNPPDVDSLLKKMRQVDPGQAKRYRQRGGQ